MDDKRRTAGNDEDIDLSGMINEYSQDNELRKKIEVQIGRASCRERV